jgi:hypothetical protein
MPTFADRGVSRGQRGGSPTVVNLSFLKYEKLYSQWSTNFKRQVELWSNSASDNVEGSWRMKPCKKISKIGLSWLNQTPDFNLTEDDP